MCPACALQLATGTRPVRTHTAARRTPGRSSAPPCCRCPYRSQTWGGNSLRPSEAPNQLHSRRLSPCIPHPRGSTIEFSEPRKTAEFWQCVIGGTTPQGALYGTHTSGGLPLCTWSLVRAILSRVGAPETHAHPSHTKRSPSPAVSSPWGPSGPSGSRSCARSAG